MVVLNATYFDLKFAGGGFETDAGNANANANAPSGTASEEWKDGDIVVISNPIFCRSKYFSFKYDS